MPGKRSWVANRPCPRYVRKKKIFYAKSKDQLHNKDLWENTVVLLKHKCSKVFCRISGNWVHLCTKRKVDWFYIQSRELGDQIPGFLFFLCHWNTVQTLFLFYFCFSTLFRCSYWHNSQALRARSIFHLITPILQMEVHSPTSTQGSRLPKHCLGLRGEKLLFCRGRAQEALEVQSC